MLEFLVVGNLMRPRDEVAFGERPARHWDGELGPAKFSFKVAYSVDFLSRTRL